MHQVCLNPNLDPIFTPPFQEAIQLNISCFISDRIWKYKSGLVVLIMYRFLCIIHDKLLQHSFLRIIKWYETFSLSWFKRCIRRIVWNLSCPFHALLDNYLQLLLDMFWTSCMQKVLISSSGELWNIRYKQVIRRFTSCSNQVA